MDQRAFGSWAVGIKKKEMRKEEEKSKAKNRMPDKSVIEQGVDS
jgi:hypothetical protein